MARPRWLRRRQAAAAPAWSLLFILALIVEYLVIPELVGASKDLYLLGRVSVYWMIAGVVLEAALAVLLRAADPGAAAARGPAEPVPAVPHRPGRGGGGARHPGGHGRQRGDRVPAVHLEGLAGTDVGVMMATKGMGSTVVLNVLLWLSLVISIPLSGFRPIYATVAIVGAVLLGAIAALVIGITRGGKRAARIVRAIGDQIPGVGGDRLEQIVLQASASLRALATDRPVLISSLTWASLNWLLDAASLWCFIAAFGAFANPVGLFAAYGIANVLGAIPVTPGRARRHRLGDAGAAGQLRADPERRDPGRAGLAAGELLAAHPDRCGRVHLAEGAQGRRAGRYAPGTGRLHPAGP